MITAKEAVELSEKNDPIRMCHETEARIDECIRLAATKGSRSVSVEDIESVVYVRLRDSYLAAGFRVEVNNWNDGSPVQFRITW